MSKVTQVSAMASPEARRATAARQQIALLKNTQTAMAKTASNIANLETIANQTFALFNPTANAKTASAGLTKAKVAQCLPALARMHSIANTNYRQAAKSLAVLLSQGLQGHKALAQMDSLSSIKTKVAALHIQAKASLAEAGDEFEEADLIPVDEQGYVVTTPDPDAETDPATPAVAGDADLPVDEALPSTVPNDDDTVVDPSVTAADDTPAGEDDLDLPDGDASLDLDNLDGLLDGLDENPATTAAAVQAAVAGTPATASLRNRVSNAAAAAATAVPASASRTAAAAMEDNVLASFSQDILG